MKTILTLSLAIVGLLCGCARLGTMLLPEQDPHVVSVDGTLKTAPNDIERFLSYVQNNQHIASMDSRVAAKGLKERYESNLLNLKNTRKLYLANRTDENKSLLLRAKESVDSDRGVASAHLDGYALPQRQGAPFAPPMAIAPPGSPPTVLDNIFERLGGIQAEQASQRAELISIRTNLSRVGHAVHSITNRPDGTVTNAPAPAIPGK